MNQDGRPIITQLNNGTINATNAMPLKDLTSNNEQSFELDRKRFQKAYHPRTNFLIPQISKSIVQRNAPGMYHGFVIDGPKTALQKKWIGGNRDASNVIANRRVRTTGTIFNTVGPSSFTSNEHNSRNTALSRVRGSGSRVPPKVAARLATVPPPFVDPNKYYRIVSAGLRSYQTGSVFSATRLSPGFYNYIGTNMTPLATTANGLFQRSYNVMTVDRTTGLTNTQSFDVFEALPGKGSITTLTSYLNGLTSDVIVVVATFDEPQTCAITDINNIKTLNNPLSATFITAMQNCGASSNFGSSIASGIINYRGSYILVGIPGDGVGSGIQRYVGQNIGQGDPNAFIDLRISILNGQYTVISG